MWATTWWARIARSTITRCRWWRTAFCADFLRAQNNGFLAQARNGTFNPAYNASIPGSQPLTVFPKLDSGGFLTDPTVRFYLETGEVGELATIYQTNELNGSVNFFKNPFALGADLITNYSSSSYNSLQLQAAPPHARRLEPRGELHLLQGPQRRRRRQPVAHPALPGSQQHRSSSAPAPIST